MHVKRGKAFLLSKIRTDHVVYAGIVGLIKEIECFNHELQAGSFFQFEATAQTHVEGDKIRPNTCVVSGTNRPVVGRVPVAINVSAGQQVKRMSRVIAENRRELEIREKLVFPGGLHHAGNHKLVPLVKIGKTAFGGKIRIVSRAKVAVEVGGGAETLAERVIQHQGDVVAETLFNLQNPAFVKGRALGRINISLQSCRSDKAIDDIYSSTWSLIVQGIG